MSLYFTFFIDLGFSARLVALPITINVALLLAEISYLSFVSLGIIAFPRSTGCKMAGRQSLEWETNFHFLAIYVVM